MKLAAREWGAQDAPRVLLIHGTIVAGRHAWRGQRPLTGRYRLVAVERLGYGDSPPGREDFEHDARLVAEQFLDRPAHVVGHSYGGLVAALASARRPEHVRSLALVEAPAFHHARGHPAVEGFIADWEAAVDGAPDVRSALRGFFDVVGVDAPLPDPLPDLLERGGRQMMGNRRSHQAVLPLERLRALAVPKLVVTGGHSAAFEAAGDVLAETLGARREIVRGARHLVPETGEPFNRLLEDFLGG